MGDTIKIEVGQDDKTGKWYARLTTPHSCYEFGPCDTEEEARQHAEAALKIVKCVFNVKKVDRIQ